MFNTDNLFLLTDNCTEGNIFNLSLETQYHLKDLEQNILYYVFFKEIIFNISENRKAFKRL